MSVYFVKGKGWRYDFTLQGTRQTEAWFKTKKAAQSAENKRKEEILNPPEPTPAEMTPTDMAFLELINLRLDYVKEYHSKRHYSDYKYVARRWTAVWGKKRCSEISHNDVVQYLITRKRKSSAITANKDLRLLRAAFNWGKNPKRGYISANPCDGVELFPVEKHRRYVPPKEDILKVISLAEIKHQDYLWTLALTLARMSEINRLKWEDIDLRQRTVTLYTRKKKGGHLTPRVVRMSDRLYRIMVRRYLTSPSRMPYVFWQTRWSHRQRKLVTGPFGERHKFMRTLCKKAGVKYFRFHPLRHFGATMMDQSNVPIGDIQKILGHENRETTEIYLHSIRKSQDKAIDILDSLYDESCKSLTQTLTQKKGPQTRDLQPLEFSWLGD